MAKSNLKILNLNFITQYSNTTIDSKHSYTYFSHFFLYYNFLLKAFIDVNVIPSLLFFSKKIKILEQKKHFFNFTQINRFTVKQHKTTFVTDINLFFLNNKFFIVYNIFNFKLKPEKRIKIKNYNFILNLFLVFFQELFSLNNSFFGSSVKLKKTFLLKTI